MATNSVTVSFAGDATALQRATASASASVTSLADDVEAQSRNVRDSFASMGDGLQSMSLAAGATAGAAMGVGLMGALEAETGNNKLEARLGLDPAEAERLGEVSGSLYAQAYGENLGEVNAAVEGVYSSIEGMSTASTKDMEAVTKAALDFADAFDIDVTRAAEVAGRAVSTGLADNAVEAFDLITVAAQNVAPELREPILDAVDEYGQFFAGLGMDGQQAFGMLVAAAEGGQYGIDKVGDAMLNFVTLSTDMSTATTDAYDAIGVSSSEMTAGILAGGDQANAAFTSILDGLLGMTDPAAQAAAAIALFGTPLEDLNVQEIPEFLQGLRDGSSALGEVEGAAAAMGETLNSGTGKSLTELGRAFQTELVDALNAALPTISAVAGWFQQWSSFIVPIVAVLGGFAVAVQAIAFAIKAWQVATVLYTAVQWLLNTALFANPIGLVILAIVALIGVIVLIATKTTWFQDAWAWAWGGITAAADWAWQKLKAIGGFIADMWRKISSDAKSAIDWVVNSFNWLVSTLTGIPGRINSAVSGMWNGMKDAFKSALNWIIGKWNGLSFTLPSITAFGKTVGGGTISTPNIPLFHTGGTVSGAMGSETLAVLQAGERVTAGRHSGGNETTLVIESGGTKLDALLVEILSRAVRVRGGNVQSVLGVS